MPRAHRLQNNRHVGSPSSRPLQGPMSYIIRNKAGLFSSAARRFACGAGWRAPLAGFRALSRGGSRGQTRACAGYNGERLVIEYKPRMVVVYAGENDLAEGASPVEVAARVREFTDRIRRALPAAHIAYVSIKPSPLRQVALPAIRDTNERIRQYLASVPNTQYIDVHTQMRDASGQPRTEFFGADRLHMNPAGYALWRREINARLPF